MRAGRAPKLSVGGDCCFSNALGAVTLHGKAVEDDRSPRRWRDFSRGGLFPRGFGLRQPSDALEIQPASRTRAEIISGRALQFCGRLGCQSLSIAKRQKTTAVQDAGATSDALDRNAAGGGTLVRSQGVGRTWEVKGTTTTCGF